jgi:hypothetical protein
MLWMCRCWWGGRLGCSSGDRYDCQLNADESLEVAYSEVWMMGPAERQASQFAQTNVCAMISGQAQSPAF